MTILRSECWQPDFIWKWTCHQLRPCWFSFSFDYSFFLFCLIFFCFFFFFIQSAISVADGIASFICNALVRGNDGGVFQRVVASLCLSPSPSPSVFHPSRWGRYRVWSVSWTRTLLKTTRAIFQPSWIFETIQLFSPKRQLTPAFHCCVTTSTDAINSEVVPVSTPPSENSIWHSHAAQLEVIDVPSADSGSEVTSGLHFWCNADCIDRIRFIFKWRCTWCPLPLPSSTAPSAYRLLHPPVLETGIFRGGW